MRTIRRRLVVVAFVTALVAAACGGGGGSDGTTAPDPTQPPAVAVGDAANGEKLYGGTCIACHGADATGVEGLGKSLIGSDFIDGLNDTEFVDFLKVGRPTSDPLNTTGVDMAPRGGNPALTDGDLEDIVAFVRTLN